MNENWRPDNWERHLLNEVKKVPDPELLKGELVEALLLFAEAGADAMLEALYNEQVEWFRLDKTDSGGILIYTGLKE